jgi:hypothetical protein
LRAEPFYGGIGLAPLPNLLRDRRLQEIPGQGKAKKEHALAGQSMSLFEDSGPVHRPVAVNKVGNITDPPQACPLVFGSMGAEDQKQILRRKAGHVLPGESYGHSALPCPLKVECEREVLGHDSRVQLHHARTTLVYEGQLAQGREVSGLLGTIQLVHRLISLARKQVHSLRHILFANEQVKVANVPQGQGMKSACAYTTEA